MILKRSIILVLAFIIAFVLALNSDVCSTSSSHPQNDSYIIDWDVLDTGGGRLSSSRFSILNSMGQSLIGESEANDKSLGIGYWYLFHHFLAGDIDGDGMVNVGDAVYISNYLLRSGPRPQPFWAGDVNCDGKINLSDPIYLANYLLKSGPPPCADP
ncbi:MAG: hypothetical protein AMJ90_09125 [candidate division Zixibacteria bacterium SM23_73_2]|nr:MAG: hypothetical protein AMJ90_09125 [candidate division Zixibacteria bacterium SM23_73_2]